MVGVHKPLDLDTPSLKVVKRKEVTGFLHVLGVVEPTQESVIMVRQVASSVDTRSFHEGVSKEHARNDTSRGTNLLYAVIRHQE